MESNVRQLLADKISGTLTGQFLLIPEFLRLGVHDLLQGLFNKSRNAYLSTRLGLQLINESALCVNGIRKARSLSQKGFEIANGLPYIVSDVDVYRTFESIPVEKIIELQIAFGKIRRAAGHYKGQTIGSMDFLGGISFLGTTYTPFGMMVFCSRSRRAPRMPGLRTVTIRS